MHDMQSAANPNRVLAFAYACEPEKGSEPGAGLMWARMLARLFDTTVITRANNRPAIERALRAIPEAGHLSFVYVDLPRWASFWKRGQRGVRMYYLLWQLAALRKARRLNRDREFDLVWHLTLANAWLGSVGSLVGPSFVYGPVGGGGGVPIRLLPILGVRGASYELLRTTAQRVGRAINPLARLAARDAVLILVQNEETREWFPARYRQKCRPFPNAVLASEGAHRSARHRSRTAIFVGRLLPFKGLAIALQALALVPDWSLIVCGAGPDRRRLERLVLRNGLTSRVAFLGWQPREEVFRLMREEADLLLFPSLHEHSGFAVVEAMAAGLPVLCLDRAGPPAIAGPAALTVDPSGGRHSVVTALAKAMRTGGFPPRATIEDRARIFQLSHRAKMLRVELAEAGIAHLGTMQ
jgi:glycosyltransferase involved in cell wall biosynthesis